MTVPQTTNAACPETSSHFERKPVMNRKFFLYAATVAVSLVSIFAMADQATPTRDQVIAEVAAARANGTLQRTDYDIQTAVPGAASNLGREQVVAEARAASASRKALTGPNANRI